ncbi:sensor histidine kinase [Bifidobacterium moukalabense]|uniref:Sensor-like histidine kinase SenX3 n=1 Tax=Bifidobacterium moukalabense DSM 27321 TaxID=1435051 RepID=W4N770_9BIFI|nr:ATP-binding protein [Bifidobacterium moukalabense]ETY70933.1 ATPase [Bifidobacterium moukalabense DSM 27321]
MLESLSLWWRSLLHRDDDMRNADDDTLDDSANALLSMLPLASIVVDDADEVIRAHPSAYTLGVVRDDAIVEESVLKAVREVRKEGGKKQFDLTTTTAQMAQSAPKAGKPTTREAARQALIGRRKDEPVSTVSRPNWLKVIVGRLNERFVVVLISDVSETIRFSQVRDSFITNVSEQLLKPTQSLERLADTLERDGADRNNIQENAAQLRRSCAHLEHMVSDLLLLIKAQEPILPTADNRINVMAQLKAVASEHTDKAALRGIAINVNGDESLEINGEAEQIQTALAKLVENAITYSPDGASVNMTAKPSEDGERVTIRVLDHGVGIDAKEQGRVFERFYRGGNQNGHSEDGIGLGLAIVKHVALTHHGSASVWSSPGQGSTFTLTLPLARKAGNERI